MVQANVDRIIDFLRSRRTASAADISKALSIPKENVQKSLEYLEEDGVLKVDYKFTTPYVTFIKDPDQQTGLPSMKLEEPKSAQSNTASPPIPPRANQNFFLNEPVLEHKSATPVAPVPPIAPMAPSSPFSHVAPIAPIIPASKDTEVTSSSLLMPPAMERAEEIKEGKLIPDINPLDQRPEFDLSAPSPETEHIKPVFKPVLGYNNEFSEKREMSFPEYINSDLDKLDFMIDEANKKITNYQYKDMNVTYRNIYSHFRDADLTPNERYLIGSKINDLFQRIRRVYLLEKAI